MKPQIPTVSIISQQGLQLNECQLRKTLNTLDHESKNPNKISLVPC